MERYSESYAREPSLTPTASTTITRYSLEIAQLSETVPRRRRSSSFTFLGTLPGAQFTAFANPVRAGSSLSGSSFAVHSSSLGENQKSLIDSCPEGQPSAASGLQDLNGVLPSDHLPRTSCSASSLPKNIGSSGIHLDRRFRRRAAYRRQLCESSESDRRNASSSAAFRRTPVGCSNNDVPVTADQEKNEPKPLFAQARRWKGRIDANNPGVATSFIHARKSSVASIERVQGTVCVGTLIQRTRYLRLVDCVLICHRRCRSGTVLWTEVVTERTGIRLIMSSAKLKLRFSEERTVRLKFFTASSAAHWAGEIRAVKDRKDE